MALENYRVIQYPEKNTVDNTDYVLIDSSPNGTNKYQVTRILTEAEAAAQTKVDAEAAAREAADSELKADLEMWDGVNLLDAQTKKNQTLKGITWAWTLGSCKVSGTATATANNDIYSSNSAMPTGFEAGKTYHVHYSSSAIRFRVYAYLSSGSLSGELCNTLTDTDFTIPSDAVGMIIRLNIATGVVVDETVRPIIPTNLTNAEIEKLIDANLLISLVNKGSKFNSITSANNIDANTIYFVSSSGGTPTVTDVPYAPAWLVTMGNGSAFNSLAVQLLIPYFSSDAMQMRVKRAGTWSDWEIYARDRTIYVNGDSYENTYNITTSPTITVDSNGWLQPVDNANTPEANATDMTGAIMSMLTETGHCHLAPGIFYVSGNIDLPFGSTLEGCGQNTIVRLLSSQESGYIAKATRFSTIKNIRFSGGASAPDLTTADIGGRHGIAFIDDVSTGEALPYVRLCMIDQCWFENFSGAGIYLNDSGGGVNQGVIASNCYIEFCKVGIDLWYYSEYHKFSNILTYHCYYGCINNGGNNMFVNCTFHGTIGFMIDNASGDRRNPGHGSAIGCTFNHIDQWNRPTTKGGGVAIKLANILNGFVFDGCQIWYGTIEIADSVGVLISNTQIGGGTPQITVTGDYATFFANCMFHALPTISVNAKTKFNQCYYDVTGELITG